MWSYRIQPYDYSLSFLATKYFGYKSILLPGQIQHAAEHF